MSDDEDRAPVIKKQRIHFGSLEAVEKERLAEDPSSSTKEKEDDQEGEENAVSSAVLAGIMHQSIETPTLWVPGKGGGFDIDPSQKASISLPPEAIV